MKGYGRYIVWLSLLVAALLFGGCGGTSGSDNDGNSTGTCESNDDCGGKVCFRGQCVECVNSSTCGGKLCVGGACSDCTTDNECLSNGLGERCESGVCTGKIPPKDVSTDDLQQEDKSVTPDKTGGEDKTVDPDKQQEDNSTPDLGGDDTAKPDAGGDQQVEPDTSTPCKTDDECGIDDNKCDGYKKCVEGVCVQQPAVTCPTGSDSCSVSNCDPASGACVVEKLKDGTPCDDGDKCTNPDSCTDGKCGGTDISSQCKHDAECVVTTCEPTTGCKYDFGSCECQTDDQCDDKKPCNGKETCDASTGKCVNGTPVVCTQLDGPCTTGTCNSEGKCEAKEKTPGTTCSNSNADSDCGTGKCSGDKCVYTETVTECDGKSCTTGDKCNADGSCSDGSENCPADNGCKTGQCGNDGNCTYPNETGLNCDEDSCTSNDRCVGGKCVPGPTLVCPVSNQICGSGVCNDGKCVYKDGHKECDGNKCTENDLCNSDGKCVPGTQKECVDDSSVCKNGNPEPVCKAGICEYTPKKAECDGNVCTVGDGCLADGSCQSGAQIKPTDPVCQKQVEEIVKTDGKSLGCIERIDCDPITGCKPVYKTGYVEDCDGSKCTYFESGGPSHCGAGFCFDFCDAGVCKTNRSLRAANNGHCNNWGLGLLKYADGCFKHSCEDQVGCVYEPTNNACTKECYKTATCSNFQCVGNTMQDECTSTDVTNPDFRCRRCQVRQLNGVCAPVDTDGRLCDVPTTSCQGPICSGYTCSQKGNYPQNTGCLINVTPGCCDGSGTCITGGGQLCLLPGNG